MLFEVDDFRSALIIVLNDLSQASDGQEILRHEFDFQDIVNAMHQNGGMAWVVELAPPSDHEQAPRLAVSIMLESTPVGKI